MSDRTDPGLTEDVVVAVELEGFDESTVETMKAILAEKGLPLPLVRTAVFIDKVKVPVNGKARFRLSVGPGGRRVIVEKYTRLPRHRSLTHHLKALYNGSQKALSYIPVVGKALEKIAPDAKQKVDCTYDLEVSADGLMNYRFLLGRAKKVEESIVVEGSLRLMQ